MTLPQRGDKEAPLVKTEAEQFLCEVHNLKRAEARQVLSEESPSWRLENRRQGEGKQATWCLLTKNDGNGNDGENSPKTRPRESPVVAVRSQTERQRRVSSEAISGTEYQSSQFVAEKRREEEDHLGNEPTETETEAWEDTYE